MRVRMIASTWCNFCVLLCTRSRVTARARARRIATVGITQPLLFRYGGDSEHAVHEWHCALVTRGEHAAYDLLIGNPDLEAYGAVLDFGQHTLSLRPDWATHGTSSTHLVLPTTQQYINRL